MQTLSLPAKKTAKPFSSAYTRISIVLVIVSLAACSPDRIPFDIRFTASFNGTALDCNSTPVALTDLRFYVSDVKLDSGESVPLLRDDLWQTRELVLIDLEDGSGFCRNGSTEKNAQLRGTLPADFEKGISFTVGVPFELNHADPLLAEAPLDNSVMHWHWRSGYKFLRAGVTSEDDGFWMHLGSAACHGTVGDVSRCDKPNRVTVTLPDFALGDSVDIDLGQLLIASELDDGARSNCSSGPAEQACTSPFAALGLMHSLAQESDTSSGQLVFRIQP